MAGARGYDYSTRHRALEVLSIAGLTVLVGAILYEVGQGLRTYSEQAWWVVPSASIAAYLAADFISGLVHFLGDTFGDEQTPVLGQSFIKPFREHHVDPRGITRHDFIETNGNNSLVCVPAAVLVYWGIPARADVLSMWLAGFLALFFVGIFMTNQFHKWSHLEHPPAWIAALQQWRLILSPEHHDLHHARPYDRCYCITTGWLNPLLDMIRFFRILEWVLGWVLPRPGREPQPTQVS